MPFFIVLLIFACIGFSFINGIIATIVEVVIVLLVLAKSYKTNLFQVTNKKLLILGLLTILYLWHIRGSNIFGFVSVFIEILSFAVVIFLNDKLQIRVINLFVKVFAVISGISLFFWILHLIGIYNYSLGVITFNGVYQFDNYIFFYGSNSILPRFKCLFVEPGAYGLLCTIALLLNDFKRDGYSFAILLSSLFTLSLATYLILVFIYFYRFLVKTKHFIALLKPIFVIGCICYLGLNYNGGDNIINNAILFRLKLDEENRLISYNRRTDDFSNFYENKVKGKILFFGIGAKSYRMHGFEDSVDYKAYIALDGLLGIFLLASLYICILKSFSINRQSFLPFLVFLIIFSRGFVFTFTMGTMIIYYLSISSLSRLDSKSIQR